MPATGRSRIRRHAEVAWWAASGLLVAIVYATWRPVPPFAGYNVWLEAVSVWLQLAIGPALLLACARPQAARPQQLRRMR